VEKVALFERDETVTRDDNMVQDINPNESARFHEATGYGEILLRWSRVARRVVVNENERTSAVFDGGKEDFAGMND
jgi:hypothetical protein